jgi:hypothetical protein
MVYRIHVSLREIQPLIWRRIELSSKTTLKQFHRILQIAMGWEDYHLHEYIVGGRRYGTPDPSYDERGEVVRESGVQIAAVLPREKSEILYVYDFGDYWQHDIHVEAIFPPEPGIRYPRIVDGARSCPPEDCGGSGGYADLLEILLDPAHEEFEHMRQWAGLRFNAEVFSLKAANEGLQGRRSLAAK